MKNLLTFYCYVLHSYFTWGSKFTVYSFPRYIDILQHDYVILLVMFLPCFYWHFMLHLRLLFRSLENLIVLKLWWNPNETQISSWENLGEDFAVEWNYITMETVFSLSLENKFQQKIAPTAKMFPLKEFFFLKYF